MHSWVLQRSNKKVEHGTGAGRKFRPFPVDAEGILFLVDENGAYRIDLATGECLKDGQPADLPAEVTLKDGKLKLKKAKGGKASWQTQ